MHLTPGRLKEMIDDALAEGSYVICCARPVIVRL
jgi:hypothetical protein